MASNSFRTLAACLAVFGLNASLGSARIMSDARPVPAMQAVLTQLASLGGKPIETLTPAQARLQPSPTDAVAKLMVKRGMKPSALPVGNVSDTTFAANGVDIPVRIYTPPGAGPFPVLVYFHGGGWVIANVNTYDASARALADNAKTIVLSVSYRQAPEHKFPAAADDAYAALQWALANAGSFKGDAKRVSVGGESAGGNLATVAAMMARDKHTTLPIHELLVYPITNYAFDTPSYIANAQSKPLNRAMMKWFFKYYLSTPADGANPYASPLRASSLAGMPPATVITDQFDPLMSEGKAYADKLSADGVAVAYRYYPGVAHEFFGMTAVLPAANAAQAFAAEQLRAANAVVK